MMETLFEKNVQDLYEQAQVILNDYYQALRRGAAPKEDNASVRNNTPIDDDAMGDGTSTVVPLSFQEGFFSLVDKVNISLLEDKDNFFGYFLMQMSREIRFDISSPTAVNFKGAKYVIHFNPIIFLNLTLRQMESTIKHEILHILSLHLIRARSLKDRYSTLAINLAMNIVVNSYLDCLPPYAVTLEWVNVHYSLKLLPFQPFEYYVEEIQEALDLLAADEDTEDSEESEEHSNPEEAIKTAYDPEKDHDLWEESSVMDDKTLQDFTEKFVSNAHKGSLPDYVENMISSLKNSNGELPWNLYLKRLMGSVESNRKKTITRRNRRQPDRLDLRGELRSHKAKIMVALDISGSISDEEFNQALKEVLEIVKNYNHEITVVECDHEIRRVYTVKSLKDIKERFNTRGGTQFSPVFAYANQKKVNLLIYFTDGKGEEQLTISPRGYKTLWVISGRGDKLSLKEPYGAVKKLKKVEIQEDSLTISDLKRDGYSMNDQESMHI